MKSLNLEGQEVSWSLQKMGQKRNEAAEGSVKLVWLFFFFFFFLILSKGTPAS